MGRLDRWRPGVWRLVFYLIVSVGLVLTAIRYADGLGAVTNLSDRYPWGLWKALNVLVGVALGGAGFTLMAAVYVFNAERFRPIVRPAVLLAFLAYTSVAVALAIDIGRSWAIWHPIVMWNKASVLFDVAWCLMLYTCVLFFEGSGMIFERLGWKRLLKAQHALTLPIVIVGVILSTLHQSSLGSLFLIVPGKLHAIWYTPIIPVLFFLSAIGAGIAVLILLARLTANAFGTRMDVGLVRDLARILVAVLGVYGVTRIFDLAHRGALGRAFDLSYESALFLVEFVLGVVVPAVLLGIPKLRANVRWLHAGAILVVSGLIANRLNVAITGFEAAQGGHYVPAWGEVVISVMVPALAFGAYTLIARYLRLFAPGEAVERAHTAQLAAA